MNYSTPNLRRVKTDKNCPPSEEVSPRKAMAMGLAPIGGPKAKNLKKGK